jgi:DeoR/GlpR family transcriptional regulator of sugar metabolism
MIAAERLDRIITKLRTQHVVSTARLSVELGVSAMTIRRDLARLEEMELCQRTHGGAVGRGRAVIQDTPYNQRQLLNVLEKRAIAQRAADFVKEGESLAIDSGTTTLQFAKALRSRRNITVITNSVNILSELSDCEDISVISTSGTISRARYEGQGEGDPCLVGPLAEGTLRRFRPDRAFMATTGLTLTDGLSNSDLEQASLKAVMMEVAADITLLADHTKFGHVAASIVGPVTLLDRLITDRGISPEFEEGLREVGVEVFAVDSGA